MKWPDPALLERRQVAGHGRVGLPSMLAGHLDVRFIQVGVIKWKDPHRKGLPLVHLGAHEHPRQEIRDGRPANGAWIVHQFVTN
jgi:hypothetical protein